MVLWIDKSATKEAPQEVPLQVATEREVPFRLRSQSVPVASNEHGTTIAQSQASTNIISTDAATPRSKESVMDKGGRSSLKESLLKIMASLDARRKAAGRPDDITVRYLNT